MDKIKLSNEVNIPVIGFGVFKAELGEQTENAVKWAFESGYRHIDTAKIYGNEQSVGNAILNSGLSRKDIFLTTKLWNDDIRAGNVREAFYESLEKLQTDYVDLYLIHWPVNGYAEAWKVLEELYFEKKIKAIGVSNFHKNHLEDLDKVATIKPMINQIESHPMFNNQELIDYCQSQKITVQAWSPLGGNGTNIISNECLNEIGKKYNKSAAQVIIRWHLQRNVIPLPKSVNKERIKSNTEVFDFNLTYEDMMKINELNQFKRVGPDPDCFKF
ncbi:aldo/keto reductase [Clostridium swellfunianum]|uniref:aldo/keto reductase n=1 Tax=Clostridium swellfunianum TaxID=1367462 RepID=UPI002548A2C0|nr:aldo/keto reductase [Clostridium swellfunianum]